MPKLNKKRFIYVAFLIVPLLLVLSRVSIFDPIKSRSQDAFSLPLRILLFPFQEIRKILFYHGTYNQYIKLKDEVTGLEYNLLRQKDIVRENEQLRELLDLKKDISAPSVAAFVISRDPNNWMTSLIVDKGSKDGLAPGMPVVTRLGVGGKIAEAGETTSKVMLINDPGFSVAAAIERSREVGLIGGTLQGICRMRYLDPNADVQVGDKVVTSKLSTSFPQGLSIGEVLAVEESVYSPSKECLVKPFVRLSELELVFIIKK